MSVSRAARLAELAAERELDALIVGDLVNPGDSGTDATSNVRWLTGFTGTSGLAVVGPDSEPLFFTDSRYTERAEAEVDPAFERVTVKGRMLAELIERLSGRIGFDDAHTSVENWRKLNEGLGEGSGLAEAGGLVEGLRRQKDEAEIEAMYGASVIADYAFEMLAEHGLVGHTEREIARAAENEMRQHGAEPSFPTIVAAGPNGALPHAEPSDRSIKKGELVVVDMGAKFDGYCSDGTRTFAAGHPDESAVEIYELVKAAQQAGLDAIGAGVTGVEADAAARKVIDDAGHGDLFGHGLGHGVGLEVHEQPRLSPLSEDTLMSGDVVSVEPGIYMPGVLGVRIEDVVVVVEDGHRNLSGTTKDLRVI